MEERPDLAAMMVPLSRSLLALEAPILASHDLPMWGYVVLNRLCEQPCRGQNMLADAIGADRTRIIDVLDDLQRRGFISRDPDPADRRTRVLAVTASGRKLRDRVRRAIRREEERFLAHVRPSDREPFLRVLRTLSDGVRER